MTDKDFVVPLLAANARENVPEQVTRRAFWRAPGLQPGQFSLILLPAISLFLTRLSYKKRRHIINLMKLVILS